MNWNNVNTDADSSLNDFVENEESSTMAFCLQITS